MKTVIPITPAIPATTTIQDPAVRRFAEAVADALRAVNSTENAIAQLDRAAAGISDAGGSTPAGILTWLAASPVYQKLQQTIAKVDVAAQQAVIAESLARQTAVDALTSMIGSGGAGAAEYDPLHAYATNDVALYGGSLYLALQATTGNLPTNTTYWQKIGDYASVGAALAAFGARISTTETNVSTLSGSLTAEVSARDTLATQLRGTYAGTDITQVTSGLVHAEKTARVSAIDAATTSLQAQISSVGNTSSAAITAEASTRSTNDNAIVSAVNTMWAITGASQAISQSGNNLITNWNASQANYWNTLNAEVFTSGGQTIRAALAQEASARATLDGNLQATWTIRADVNGYVAGIGLGVQGGAGGTTSQFIIQADKFAMVMPGYGNYVPFSIGAGGVSYNGSMAWSGVTGTGKPADNATSSATLINHANMTIVGNTVTKTSGTADYNSGFYSKDGFTGGCYVSWTPVATNTIFMIGLNTDPDADAGYTTIDYALLCYSDGALHYSESGSVTALGQSYAAGDALSITYDGTAVRYMKNGVVLRTVTAAINARLYADSSFHTVGSSAKNIQFGPLTGLSDAITSRTKLTPGNVTTFIDNAAIGNAQIGGNIWSDNYAAGSAGWIINRSGNAEFRNILARGDIEATSLKVDSANIVQTLHLNGEAVTVPRSAYTAGSTPQLPPVDFGWFTAQSLYIDASGQKVLAFGGATAYATYGATLNGSMRIVAPSGTVIAQAVVPLVPDNATSNYVGSCFFAGESYEAGTYRLQFEGSPVSSCKNRSLTLIGCKR